MELGDLCPCLDVCFHFCSLNKFGILVYLGKKIILNFLWFYLNSFSVFCVRWVFGISICRKLVTSGVGSSAFHLDKWRFLHESQTLFQNIFLSYYSPFF